MQLRGAKVAVVGLGASGLAASRFVLSQGAQLLANDIGDGKVQEKELRNFKAQGAEIMLGHHDAERLAQMDLIVLSPGVPPLAELELAQTKGVSIVSEVELASWFIEAPMVAITGTNGKSTVTTLIGQMLKRLNKPVFVGGNLGRPFLEVIGTEASKKDGWVVVELSSFQLERIKHFHPKVAVLTNLSADHLDRYPSFEAYAQAKARIFENQTEQDIAVLPAGDADCLDLAKLSKAKKLFFGGRDGEVRNEGEQVLDTRNGATMQHANIGIKGGHNMTNVACSWLVSRQLGVPVEALKQTLQSFHGLAHRMQKVCTWRGIDFVNDSKATNVGAATASVRSFAQSDGRVVLIAGGKHKGSDYAPLVRAMKEHGRAVVVLGEAADQLQDAFGQNECALQRADSIQSAVQLASGLAQAGDTVLLAPACSSYDMFRSYAQRGEAFARAALALQKELA